MKINTDGYDKIYVDTESLINFQKWFDIEESKAYFMPTIKKGVIIMNENNVNTYLFFECKDSVNIKFKCVLEEFKVAIEWERVNGEFRLITKGLNDLRVMMNFQMFTINEMFFYHTIHYMNIEPYRVEKKTETKAIVKNKKKKKSINKSKKRMTYISNRIFKVNMKREHTESEKREYKRRTEGWMVRGHWRRNPKSGGRTWIDAFPKGDLRNILDKEYKILT